MKNKLIITALGVVVLGILVWVFWGRTAVAPEDTSVNSLTETQARDIAEKFCIKGGEALGQGSYNENSQTWWFDANLNSTPEGCNPACVVSENGTAEINWRCTGLIPPQDGEEGKQILEAFKLKYPKYKAISISLEKQVSSYARGSVLFVAGQPGGNFLARKQDTIWQIVFEGNGPIPCSLAEQGFPLEMLEDCAK